MEVVVPHASFLWRGDVSCHSWDPWSLSCDLTWHYLLPFSQLHTMGHLTLHDKVYWINGFNRQNSYCSYQLNNWEGQSFSHKILVQSSLLVRDLYLLAELRPTKSSHQAGSHVGLWDFTPCWMSEKKFTCLSVWWAGVLSTDTCWQSSLSRARFLIKPSWDSLSYKVNMTMAPLRLPQIRIITIDKINLMRASDDVNRTPAQGKGFIFSAHIFWQRCSVLQ